MNIFFLIVFSFFDSHRNKSTTWTDPRPQHYEAFHTFCSTLPLPENFEQAFDTQGNTYFINHQTKQTYWDDPRLSSDRPFLMLILSYHLLFVFDRFLSFIDDKTARCIFSIVSRFTFKSVD